MSNTTSFNFKFQGKSYTFTGEPKQVANMRKSVEAATAKIEAVVAVSTKRGPGRPRIHDAGPSQASIIRAWAKEQGLKVGERGRLNPEVVAAYAEAHDGE